MKNIIGSDCLYDGKMFRTKEILGQYEPGVNQGHLFSVYLV